MGSSCQLRRPFVPRSEHEAPVRLTAESEMRHQMHQQQVLREATMLAAGA